MFLFNLVFRVIVLVLKHFLRNNSVNDPPAFLDIATVKCALVIQHRPVNSLLDNVKVLLSDVSCFMLNSQSFEYLNNHRKIIDTFNRSAYRSNDTCGMLLQLSTLHVVFLVFEWEERQCCWLNIEDVFKHLNSKLALFTQQVLYLFPRILHDSLS